MNNLDLSLEIDRKKEYTKQVVNILNIRLYEGINTIYKDAKKLCKQKGTRNYLEKFQELLTTIPKWSKEVVSKELVRIKIKSNCNWLEELITAVFVSHTKVLTAIKGNRVVDLEIPNCVLFIHKCYIECARVFWKNPYLFSDESITPCEYQRNLRDCETIISKKIAETIRKMLPIELILKNYLGNVQQKTNDTNNSSIITIIDDEKEAIKKIVEKDLEDSFKNYSIKQNDTTTTTNENTQEINNDVESVTVESLSSKEVKQLNNDNTNSVSLPKELQSNYIQPQVEQPPQQTQPVVESVVQPVVESQQTQPVVEDLESVKHQETLSKMDNLLNQHANEINNLDVITEKNIEVNRVKDKQDTLDILKNSEETRVQSRKKYSKYLFK